jgi:hypothetical protein
MFIIIPCFVKVLHYYERVLYVKCKLDTGLFDSLIVFCFDFMSQSSWKRTKLCSKYEGIDTSSLDI